MSVDPKHLNIKSSRPTLNDLGRDASSFKDSLTYHLTYTVGKDEHTATQRDWFQSLAYVVRDHMIERWLETMRSYYAVDSKRVYYLSLEFLIGRTMGNSLINMGLYGVCEEVLSELGFNMEELLRLEGDAALGNGGLGRLAACFLDSLATLQLPGFGYGIRYQYGMFQQKIDNGSQVEHPDDWLRHGNAWEYPRPDPLYKIKFGGHVSNFKTPEGKLVNKWEEAENISAMAYDTPIPGYGSKKVNNLRLWSAKATHDFDLNSFNQGDYVKSVQEKNLSENLSKVLYPDDSTEMGRELRFKQEYFFVSASIQDILHRYGKVHEHFNDLPDKVSIQLNDTHPSIGIVELMRVLIDTHQLEWIDAWEITQKTFAYTNHTLLPEALETWPVSLFEKVLPRHLQIIYEINQRFLKEISDWRPDDSNLLNRMSIISCGDDRRVRMSHLAIIGSHKVNGVAKLHSQLMQSTIFADFNQLYPDKFINITNGITPRRWLNSANPKLAGLITSYIGTDWITDLTQLKQLEKLSDDKGFQEKYRAVKQYNKDMLADKIKAELGIEVNTSSIFDIQIKRIHEYKRQLLNVLHVITLYNHICEEPDLDYVPRTVIFSGKAAPGYAIAKLIIQLIHNVADVVNNDPVIDGRIKVVFIPNYDVKTAMDIIPAADLSEQISTAGTEASGTGNMKLSLNGALTIGTLDGANIEIMEEVGEENFFTFGLTADEVAETTSRGYNPYAYYESNEDLKKVLDMINNGYFSPDDENRFKPLFNNLVHHGDQYFLLADYEDYMNCQKRVEELYKKPEAWTRQSIINCTNMGKFSSDRTILEYAEQVWDVSPKNTPN